MKKSANFTRTLDSSDVRRIRLSNRTVPSLPDGACLIEPSVIQQEEPLRPLFAQLGQVTVIYVSPNGIVMKETKMMIG